jgi:hypothetical protein
MKAVRREGVSRFTGLCHKYYSIVACQMQDREDFARSQGLKRNSNLDLICTDLNIDADSGMVLLVLNPADVRLSDYRLRCICWDQKFSIY